MSSSIILHICHSISTASRPTLLTLKPLRRSRNWQLSRQLWKRLLSPLLAGMVHAMQPSLRLSSTLSAMVAVSGLPFRYGRNVSYSSSGVFSADGYTCMRSTISHHDVSSSLGMGTSSNTSVCLYWMSGEASGFIGW